MAMNWDIDKQETKVEVKKQPTYRLSLFKTDERLPNETREVYTLYSSHIPQHEDLFVNNNRLWHFIAGVGHLSRCAKTRNFSKDKKVFYNRIYTMDFLLLGSIENISLDLVKETMPFLETGFDGWAFLPFENYDKLAIHEKYRDQFVKICVGALTSDVYILYEKVN